MRVRTSIVEQNKQMWACTATVGHSSQCVHAAVDQPGMVEHSLKVHCNLPKSWGTAESDCSKSHHKFDTINLTLRQLEQATGEKYCSKHTCSSSGFSCGLWSVFCRFWACSMRELSIPCMH